MRKHRHSRPKHRAVRPWPPDKSDPAVVAARAVYEGSAEHKSYPSSAGHPRLRSDASRCDPRYVDFQSITEVLRLAIRRQCTGATFEGEFPKYVWGWLDGRLYEARHINGPVGTYKAYPIESLETPKDDKGRLNWDEANAPI